MNDDVSARPLWQGRTLALIGIILVAFSLRSAVAGLSPLYDHIEADFAVPAAIIGLIGTAPPVCFAVFGLLTPALERRLGLERLATLAMLVIAAGLLLRSLAGGTGILLAGTALVFAGVGTGNVLLPPLVRKYFPDRVGLVTTIYAGAIALSTFLPPLLAVPMADATDWHVSLGMWAVFALAAMIPWIALSVRQKAADAAAAAAGDEAGGPRRQVFGRMWRIPLAWALLVGFAVSSIIAYTFFAWLPTILIDVAGVTPAVAGGLLALFGALGMPASLIVPIAVARWRATRLLFGIAIASGLLGIGGLLLIPGAVTWVWVTLLGNACMLFPVTLVLLGLRAHSHEGSVALSGFVQSGGYTLAAIFPLGVGLLHEATGSWTVPLIVLAGVVAAAIPAGLVASRDRTIEEVWERRHGAW